MSNFLTFLQGEKRREGTKDNNYDRRAGGRGDYGITAPMTYADIEDIVRTLKDGQGVLVDFKSTPFDASQRMLDFLSGAVYAIEGAIEKVNTKIYLVTPKGIKVGILKK